MSASLQKSFESLSTSDVVFVLARSSQGVGSIDTQLAIGGMVVERKFGPSYPYQKIADIGSAYTEDCTKLSINNILNLKNLKKVHIIVTSADRLSRNRSLSGSILHAIERKGLTVHVENGESPYTCSLTHGNIDRLEAELDIARKESDGISARSIRASQYQKMLASQQPVLPPSASEEVMNVLDKMINGCATVQEFYEAFNKIKTRYSDTEDRLGGPNFIAENRFRQEFTDLKKGDFTFRDILGYFNKWEIFRKGKTNWTTTTLSELIAHHFGAEVLARIRSGQNDMEDEEDEDDDVRSPPKAKDDTEMKIDDE